MSTLRSTQLQKVSRLQRQVVDAITAFKRNQDVASMTNVAKLQEEIITTLIDLAGMDNANSGSDISMIQVQNLVTQRALAFQMATSLFKEMNSATKTIISNMGR